MSHFWARQVNRNGKETGASLGCLLACPCVLAVSWPPPVSWLIDAKQSAFLEYRPFEVCINLMLLLVPRPFRIAN